MFLKLCKVQLLLLVLLILLLFFAVIPEEKKKHCSDNDIQYPVNLGLSITIYRPFVPPVIVRPYLAILSAYIPHFTNNNKVQAM